MSTEYSVEEVRAHARMLRECRINTEATRDSQQDKLADICDAYADLLERIKADEGVVPVYQVREDGVWRDVSPNRYDNAEGCDRRTVFTRPPAQAAQGEAVDIRSAFLRMLERGNHRTDGDMAKLLDRLEHMVRGDQDCIAAQRMLITDLKAAQPRAVPAERMPKDGRVYQCSNEQCRVVHAIDPQGHCPACVSNDGRGWSTIPRKFFGFAGDLEPTPQQIEAGAKRLVSWEDGSVWPDSWSPLQIAAARNEAERVWRSMVLAAAPSPGESA